jgi:PAS domain S-box-containing protein
MAVTFHSRSDTLTLTVLSAAAVIMLAAGSYWVASEQDRAASLVSHTHEVLAGVSRTRAWLVEAQNAYRGFVITGRDEYLQPRDDPLARLRDELQNLRSLTADNPSQQSRLAEFDAALAPFLASGERVIAARRSGGFAAAQAIIDSDVPRSQRARLREVLDAVERDERSLLQLRTEDHQTRLQWFWWTLTALVAVIVTTLQFLYWQSRRRQVEQRLLLQSEQRFHVLARSVVDYAIFLLDPAGNVVSWSAGAEKITGYRADEIIGHHFSVFYPQDGVQSGKPARELAEADANGRSEEEGWRLRKDGTRYWSSVVITALHDESGALTGFGKVTCDLTERKRAEESLVAEVGERRNVERQLRDLNDSLERLVADRTTALTAANAELSAARDRLQDLSARLIAAQEDERRRIARELHDDTGGALSLIRLQLDAALRNEEKRTARIEDCVRIVGDAVKQIRSLARNLRPAVLDDLGLADALQALLEQQAEVTGWHVSLEAEMPGGRLATEIETACFRIGQEALTNTARHAAAKSVEVRLRSDERAVELEVSDDGSGFDYEALQSTAARGRHFGLVSMSERAHLAGGTFAIDTSPGRGTRVRVAIPLHM